MTNCKRVIILAAIHGDEVYGVELYNKFVVKYPELSKNVSLVIGNRKAYEEKTRFIDIDLNRAFNLKNAEHESIEIKRIEKELKDFNADYIIDIHTTRRDSGIFYISDNLNIAREDICNLLDIDVCIMKDKVIESSFIGNNDKAVSIEYSLKAINKETTEGFINNLNLLITDSNKLRTPKYRKIYKVKRLITRAEYRKYRSLKNHDVKIEGIALMIPKDNSEMDAEYYGFWCAK